MAGDDKDGSNSAKPLHDAPPDQQSTLTGSQLRADVHLPSYWVEHYLRRASLNLQQLPELP